MESASPDRSAIGRRRKALRVEVGLKQEELAERAGTSTYTVGRAEAGELLSEAVIRALAAALGVPSAEYLGPDLAPEPAEAAS